MDNGKGPWDHGLIIHMYGESRHGGKVQCVTEIEINDG